MSENLTARGQRAGNLGLPSLDLEQCNKDAIPSDWDITGVLGDILMCEYVDENETGEVMRNGIYVQKSMVPYLWRVVKVLKIGPQASENIKEGDFLMLPSDKGIKGITKDKKNLVFINEPRVFAKVKPRE